MLCLSGQLAFRWPSSPHVLQICWAKYRPLSLAIRLRSVSAASPGGSLATYSASASASSSSVSAETVAPTARAAARIAAAFCEMRPHTYCTALLLFGSQTYDSGRQQVFKLNALPLDNARAYEPGPVARRRGIVQLQRPTG